MEDIRTMRIAIAVNTLGLPAVALPVGMGHEMSIDRLGPLDRFMLRVSRTWPQDIGALLILDGAPLMDPAGRFEVDVVREEISRRLHLLPRLRQVIAVPRRGLGPPYWSDVPALDIAAHVRELPLEPPVDGPRVLAVVEGLRRLPLDPSRPMWAMWFLTGLPGRRIAWFVRLHHTMGDGMASVAALTALLEQEPTAPPVDAPRWQPVPAPSTIALLGDALGRKARGVIGAARTVAHPGTAYRRTRASWPAVRELLAESPSTPTSLDRMIGQDRLLALARAPVGTCRTVARKHHATVNDVLLAATAVGLRAVLRHRGESTDATTVRVYVPVSLRRRLRGPLQGNLIAQMAVPLDLSESDPTTQIGLIAAETRKRKARLRTSLGTMMHGGPIARHLMIAAVMRQRVNVTTASIPGPKRPLFLAGARVLEAFPVLPLVANEPLGLGALSYAGTLNIGVVADRDVFPDLGVFAAAALDAFVALGIPASPADLGLPSVVVTT